MFQYSINNFTMFKRYAAANFNVKLAVLTSLVCYYVRKN